MVHGVGAPIAVRRLELVQEHEGLVSVPLGQPIDAIVLDDLRAVAAVFRDRVRPVHAEDRLEIGALPSPVDQNLGVIKACGLRPKVPLPDDRRFIAIGLEDLGKRELASIEIPSVHILVEPVLMGKFPREDGRPARSTNGIRAVHRIHPGPVLCDAVDVGRRGQLADVRTIGTDRLVGEVVGHDVQDVHGLLIGPGVGCALTGGQSQGNQEESEKARGHGVGGWRLIPRGRECWPRRLDGGNSGRRGRRDRLRDGRG